MHEYLRWLCKSTHFKVNELQSWVNRHRCTLCNGKKYLNLWFSSQKQCLKKKISLLRKRKYRVKFEELIQLYDKCKLKPGKLQIPVTKPNNFNNRNRDEIECGNLNEYSDSMNSNYNISSKSPTSLSHSSNKDKIDYHIRNLINLHRDIDNVEKISNNPDIKKWILVINAKTNI